MKVVTWNVNSVRARKERLLAFLERQKPDVVCLQELKVEDPAFPREDIEGAGFHVETHGQKTYNGVAILSRWPISDVQRGMGDEAIDAQARLLAGTVQGVRILSAYMPNGGDVGSDKFVYKLAWLDRLEAHLKERYEPSQPLALCGDYNVALDDLDVAKPDAWADSVLCHPDARARIEAIRAFGFVDTVRAKHPQGQVYTWWDYRMLAFPKGDGLRIDHIFATEPLAKRCAEAEVDRDERRGKQPSDHAPVMVTFQV